MDLKTHIRETIKLAVPISFGQLGHIMMGIVDSIMVGKVSYASLAAASLVNGLFSCDGSWNRNVRCGYSANCNCKRCRQRRRVWKILNHSFIINIIFSFILIAGIYAVALLIPHLNQTAEVTKKAVPYMKVLTASIIPFIIFQTYRQFLEGL
jgi:multidrug resistance protein, MATE family